MTPERIYSALLLAYPAPFRREYGSDMLEAFRRLDESRSGSRLRFWLFLLADVARSALLAHVDACRVGSRRFSIEWAGACASGAIVTALLANALTSVFSYLYHPYLEGITLPPWSYGTLLGVALGTAQTVVLRHRFRLGLQWVIASGFGAALGLEAAAATARIAGPVGYGFVLGSVVGGVQWAVLRTRVRQAAWWGLASAVAWSVAMFSCAVSLHTTLDGLNPLSRYSSTVHAGGYGTAVDFLARGLYRPDTRADLAIELFVMVTSGVMIALLTAKPLSVIHAHQERS